MFDALRRRRHADRPQPGQPSQAMSHADVSAIQQPQISLKEIQGRPATLATGRVSQHFSRWAVTLAAHDTSQVLSLSQ